MENETRSIQLRHGMEGLLLHLPTDTTVLTGSHAPPPADPELAITGDHRIAGVFCGDIEAAHQVGCQQVAQ